MKNETNATVTGPRTTSAPLRIKTNVRAGIFAWLWSKVPQTPPRQEGNAVGGVRG
jgi:hypothetical protein